MQLLPRGITVCVLAPVGMNRMRLLPRCIITVRVLATARIYRIRLLPHSITVCVLATAGMNVVQLLPHCITVRALAATGMITARVLLIVGMIVLATAGTYI